MAVGHKKKVTYKLRSLVLLLSWFLAAPATFAASVSLVPVQTDAPPGSQIQVEIRGDFTDEATLGGGMDVSFDHLVLQFVNYIDNGLGDPQFQRDPDASEGLLAGAAFGDFNGFASSDLIGTLVFNVLPGSEEGPTTITVGASAGVAGPFASDVDFMEQGVQFNDAEVNILGEVVLEDGFESK